MAFNVEVLASRLQNSYIWYREHKGEISSVEKRVEFLERCIEDQYALWSHVVEYLHQFHGMTQDQRPSLLYRPRGLELRGDLKRFG